MARRLVSHEVESVEGHFGGGAVTGVAVDEGLTVGVLGPLTVSAGGRPAALTAGRLRSLLVALALPAGAAVSVDRLAAAMWGEDLPADVRRAVTVNVTRLRRVLGRAAIGAVPAGYRLRIEPDRVDAVRFARLLDAAGHAADADAERERLVAALALWRGTPFEDVPSAWLAEMEAPRLVELRVAALERRIELDLAQRWDGALIAELCDLTARYPLRERFWGQLMTALYRSGRRADALGAYQRLYRMLTAELGIEPSHPVQELHRRILTADATLEPPAGSAGADVPVHRRLPAGIADVTGRPETPDRWAAPLSDRPEGAPVAAVAAVAAGTAGTADEGGSAEGNVGGVAEVAFVGRADEQRRLAAAFTAAAAGRPAVMVVAGEAGVGKTALVEQAAAAAEAAGAVVFSGGCVGLGQEGLPLVPFVSALRRLAGQVGVDELGGLLPGTGVGDLVAGLSAPGAGPELGGGSPGSWGRLAGLFMRLVDRLGSDRPVLLVVEDLHWSDRSTRDLLSVLARGRDRRRLLILVTVRTDDLHPGHPARAFLADLQRLRRVERMELGRLSRSEVAELVSGVLGERAPAPVVDRIFARSEGNAFFVEELLRAQNAAPGAAVSLRELLLDRIERLPDPSRRVVRVAAVGGRRVSHGLLTAVAGMNERALLDALRGAVEGHVLEAESDGYAFRHELVREATLEDLLPAERTSLHHAYARALDACPDLVPADQVAVGLVHHWCGAAELAKALPALLRAAAAAEAMNAYAEQYQLLRRALDLWPRLSHTVAGATVDHGALVEAAAGAAWRAGEQRHALELVDRALYGLDERQEPERVALLLARRARLLLGLGEDVLGVVRAAERLVPRTGSPARAAVLEVLGVAHIHSGAAVQACEASTEAARLASELGDDELQVAARLTAGMALANLGRYDRGLAELEVAGVIAERGGDETGLTRAHLNVSYLLWAIGRYQQAIGAAATGAEVARKAGLIRSLHAHLAANRSASLFAIGRWREADAEIAHGLDPDPPGLYGAGIRMVAAELALARGELGRAQDLLATARAALHDRYGLAQGAQPLARLTAEIALRQNKLGEARAAVTGALGINRWRGDAAHAWSLLDTAIRLEARARARRRAPGAEPGTDHWIGMLREVARGLPTDAPPWQAQAVQFTAEVESPTAPSAAWADVVAAWDEAGMPYRAACARCRAAEAALACGRRSPARRWLGEALEQARGLGAGPLVGKIQRVARGAEITLGTAPEPAEMGTGVAGRAG